jgi:hypothetical protein
MNRLISTKNSFQLLGASLLTISVSLGSYANEPSPKNQSKARQPKPTFFEQTRKGEAEREQQKGFEATFLSDALNGVADPLGGTGGSASGLSNAGFQGQSNTSFNISPNSPSFAGIFTGTSPSTASFFSGNSTLIIGNLNTSSQPLTLTQGGATYFSTNYGLSGNSGFAVFTINGQTTTFIVDNLPTNRNSVPVGQTFTGKSVFSNGLAPDQ